MKIDVQTSNPQALLDQILKDCNSDVLKTWVDRSYQQSKLITHKPDQWYDKALLKLSVSKETLTITISYWDGQPIPDIATKGYFLGRFTEILLVHYGNYYTNLIIS